MATRTLWLVPASWLGMLLLFVSMGQALAQVPENVFLRVLMMQTMA